MQHNVDPFKRVIVLTNGNIPSAKTWCYMDSGLQGHTIGNNVRKQVDSGIYCMEFAQVKIKENIYQFS